MRGAAVIGLATVLLAGCQHFVRTMDVRMSEPVTTRVEANLTAPDEGPLHEVSVPCGQCPSGAGKVAIIDVDGILVDFNPVGPYSAGENPVAAFTEKLTAAARDPRVRAVVLRINSPGGGVAATDLMAQAVRDFRQCSGKPVVACLLDLGTGGAYYLASVCDAIVAIPSAVVGGIGVVLNIYYAEVAMEQMNIFNSSIKAGERIDMGTSMRKLTDEERKLFTAMAEEYHTAFKNAVRASRPKIKADAEFFDGRVLTASQAAAGGLVDAIGYLPEALKMAGELAQAGPLRSIMYCRKNMPARSLYASTSNRPIHATAFPWSVPGIDRSRLPLFLYLWQPEPTMLRLTGI